MTEQKTIGAATRGAKAKAQAGDATTAQFDAGRRLFDDWLSLTSKFWWDGYDKWLAAVQDGFERGASGVPGADTFTGAFGDMGADTLEAWRASAKNATDGAEQISEKFAAIVTELYDESRAAGESLMACKDFKQVIDASPAQGRKWIETWMAGGTELSELAIATTAKSFAPINDQVLKTFEKVTRKAA